MPNLKEIRNRITSVGSTMQITSAMKMVAGTARSMGITVTGTFPESE